VFTKKLYFNSVRKSLFAGGMKKEQVDGQEAILTQWEHQDTPPPMTDLRWLAYMLATTYHETARRMWPIEEYGKGKGKEYGKRDKETGQTYFGRGFVQLTWRSNYHDATVNLSLTDDRDLEYHPAMALDLVIASKIMFRGMSEGWFTNKKLGHYFSGNRDDPVAARAIINNDVSKNGRLIAGHHQKFLDALEASFIQEIPAVSRPIVRLEGDLEIWHNGVQIN
jgi:putative chitinase